MEGAGKAGGTEKAGLAGGVANVVRAESAPAGNAVKTVVVGTTWTV